MFIVKYAIKWRKIGLELNIASDRLNIIEENNPKKVQECCRIMLDDWLEEDSEASWEKLLHAVETKDKQHYHSASLQTGKNLIQYSKIEKL